MAQENFVLGNEFFVFDGSTGVPLAYATECSLSISADTIETSNKMSGTWASALPGQNSWTVSTSALYAADSSWGYNQMFQSMSQRRPYKIKFGRVKNYNTIPDYTNPANYTLDASAGYYEGDAYLTSLELSAGNGEVASMSAEFTGNGQIQYKTA